jgi:hypothetical protein
MGIRKALAGTALAIALSGGGAATAIPASASPAVPQIVLINGVQTSVCVGRTFQVGVWYQQFSGGPRRFTISVFNPINLRVFYRTGLASASAWMIWNIRAHRTGVFRTVYRTYDQNGRLLISRFRTTARNC